MTPLALAPLVMSGCFRVPPEAPKELDELTHYLYREWGNEDPFVMQAGMDNLREYFDGVDVAPDVQVLDRSWELTSITDAELADIDHPGRNTADTWGVGVAYDSAWDVPDHADWQTRVDQLPSEPSATVYVRSFPETDDPACFGDASCEVLVTHNDLTRSNFLMTVSMLLYKDFRWVELSDGRMGAISRSWIDEPAVGENGNNTIYQSFSLDVWLPNGGTATRYQVLWSEADVAGAGDDLQIATVKTSTDQHFDATDEALGEE